MRLNLLVIQARPRASSRSVRPKILPPTCNMITHIQTHSCFNNIQVTMVAGVAFHAFGIDIWKKL